MRKHLHFIIALTVIVSMLFAFPVMASDEDPQVTDPVCQHEWSTWEETVEATCSEPGEEERVCALCEAVETRAVKATGNHYWDEWYVAKRATVFKKGTKQRECLECGKVQKKAISKVKPFAKFKKKKYTVKKGKTLKLKSKVKMGRGDSIKKWKVNNKKIATISKNGKIKARKKGTVKVTAFLKSGKKATCTVKIKTPKKPKKKKSSSGGTVYWTPSGSVYHVSRGCPTLSRSRTVYSGSIQQSHKSRCCKVCG